MEWNYLGFIVVDLCLAGFNLYLLVNDVHEHIVCYNASKWWYAPNLFAAIASVMVAGYFTGKMLGL